VVTKGVALGPDDTHRAGTHQDPSTPDHPLLPPPFTDLYNSVLREGFFNFKLPWSPSTQKKFCKNFKPDGEVPPNKLRIF